ncbi:hypothetical protein TrRE_jg10712 [Triparma retinervis]|uniref:Uncharacterized protein n=1 Tax=Triparma retinervis TaxID=2557542 RepID=A0A9W6ZT85_9STRA|nr:hypothetical protein TrRE_jg10712 [Triparma retinervis]
MDALVSRELLHFFFLDGDVLHVQALRAPNKATLNGDYALVDDLNKFRVKEGDVVSLYQDKYRYEVSRCLSVDAPKNSSSSASPSSSQQPSQSPAPANRKQSSSKVAPQASRRMSKIEQTKSKITAAVIGDNEGGSSALQWAMFFVFSGCAIAIVYIIGRNSSSENSETGTSDRRMLRGGAEYF